MLSYHDARTVFSKHATAITLEGEPAIPQEDLIPTLWDAHLNPMVATPQEILGADASGDGLITWEEFHAFYRKLNSTVTDPQKAMAAFRVLDLDGNGVVSQDEMDAFTVAGASVGLNAEDYSLWWDSVNVDCTLSATEYLVSLCPEIDLYEIRYHVAAYYPDNPHALRRQTTTGPVRKPQQPAEEAAPPPPAKDPSPEKPPPTPVASPVKAEPSPSPAKAADDKAATSGTTANKERQDPAPAAAPKPAEKPKEDEKKAEKGGCCAVM